MLALLTMPLWLILLLLFIFVVVFNVFAKLLADFIRKLLGGK